MSPTAATMRRLGDPLRSQYVHLAPRGGQTGTPPVVVVHGQSRDVDAQVQAFLPWADSMGLQFIAPWFTNEHHHGYQRLRTRDPERSASDVLDDILADAGVPDRQRILLFGFSGGAQFAHRYALLRADKLAALSIAAAGWYTFPDINRRFPYGIADESLPGMRTASLSELLSVPIQVLVGERDTERDSSLRRNRRIDRQQGPNRVARALAWVEAMRRLAPDAGPPELEVLPRAGHRFEHCVRAGLVECVTQWFSRHLDDTGIPLRLSGVGGRKVASESTFATFGLEDNHVRFTKV